MYSIIKLNRNWLKILFASTLFGLINACVEPFDFKSETYNRLLVVEGTITNEMKKQEIYLSYVYRIDNDTIIPESNAQVTVIDETQNEFEFRETESGRYESVNQFRLSPDRKYHLEITTSNGRSYASEAETLPENNAVMNDLYAERAVNNQGVKGIAIYSNSTNPGQEGISYYKYTYQETYKIKSPYTSQFDLILESSGRLDLVPKTAEEEICYNTLRSREILLADTGAYSENEISDFLVKFFRFDDFAIQNRYSIQVNQISISQEAYDYYETLKELSGSESVFSQNQPGFINGNLYSIDDPNEKIIGNFNLGKVSSRRIFFNFTDFFNLNEKPDPLRYCEIRRPEYRVLVELVRSNQVKFYDETYGAPPDDEGEGPYRVLPTFCIDCTVLGTTEKPEFWID